MKGPRNGERNGSPAAASLKKLYRFCKAVAAPGNHHLPGRIEIHRLHGPHGRGFTAGFNNGFVIEANDGCHAAHTDRHRFLHGLRTETHKLHGILKGKCSRRRERGIFP